MKDKLYRLWDDPRRPLFVVGLIAFNAGAGLGYILGRRTKYSIINEDKMQDLINIYTGTTAEQINTKQDPVFYDEGQTFIEKIISEDVEEDKTLIRRSIFVDGDEWNYELEISKRTKDEPYVIHRDEFFNEEIDYAQSTFTYYAGDSILVDESDTPVFNHLQITGQLLFGHGSGDKNVVYIRNDKRRAEYEIVFDPSLYSVEILGLEIENNTREKDIKHSKQLLRFRPD